jgi:hypothetical protein
MPFFEIKIQYLNLPSKFIQESDSDTSVTSEILDRQRLKLGAIFTRSFFGSLKLIFLRDIKIK